MSRKRPATKSFVYAFDGIKEAITNEPNFRAHLAIAAIALVAAFFFKIAAVEWLILLLTISSVIVLELVNTAIEALVDLASPRIHPKAKVAKDVAAAAVLGSAFIAVIIGAIIFLPKIILVLGL